jgi:hypothetical protein
MTEPALQPSPRPTGGDEAANGSPPGPPAADHAGRPPGLEGGASSDRGGSPDGNGDAQPLCTQAQLRRFIKSRPYVPLHELRRRFGLNGADDDVAPVDVRGTRLFVGLPAREGGLLGELIRQGDVGYELLLDPVSPTIIGVFPIRPVQRP